MVEVILPSYVIFHFEVLDLEHKVEENAPRLLRKEMGTYRESREFDDAPC